MNESIEIHGTHRFIFRDAATGEVLRENTYENLIVTVCKNMIAKRLAGDANDCNITYGAVGTGAGVPAVGDTTLSTELARKAITSGYDTGSVTTIITFFGASEAIGVLTEFGLFGEAAGIAPDSGTMICHSLISETKTAAETLTIESNLTIA